MSRLRVWAVAVAVAGLPAWTQQRPLPGREALELCTRSVELMEATAVAAPELVRAGAPVTENARHAVTTMRSLGGLHAALTYTVLANARAYLALADVVPKPQPMVAETARQFQALREDVERLEAHFRALLEAKESQLRSPDRDNLARYAEANAALGPPRPGRPRVAFLGDSITDGWRLNEYFADRDFVNRGIGGQITGEMLGRMKADVLDSNPAAVLVLAGTNDLARGVPQRTVQNNLAMIARLAEASGVKVLLASVLPVSDYHKDKNPQYEMTRRRPPGAILELNQWIQKLCRERGYVYVDYFSAMVDGAGFLKAELADDGLHPNSAGYRVMAPVAEAAIGQGLAGKGKRKR